MAIDNLTITEVPKSVDTLKFLDTELAKDAPKEDKIDRTIPARSEDDEVDDKPIKLTESEDDEKVEDEIDFRPSLTKKDLVKAYPDILTKFPQLERAIYRERQFSELFPTIQDAKNTIERAHTLDNTETELASGNLANILETIKNSDKEIFLRTVDNFLPSVRKVDEGTYLQFVGNLTRIQIKDLLARANRFNQDTDEHKNLTIAAAVLNTLWFGNSEWKEPSFLAKQVADSDEKINNREKELLHQRFTEVQSDLNERATNAIKSTIIQYIDPRESMSEYVKAKAIDDCGSQLQEQINQDKNFITKLDNLWKSAADSNFSKASLEKIKNTYFAKAQVLLPEIIKSVRAKAMSGMGKNVPSKKVTEREDNPRASNDNGRSASNKSGQDDQPKRRESTKDFLNRTLGE